MRVVGLGECSAVRSGGLGADGRYANLEELSGLRSAQIAAGLRYNCTRIPILLIRLQLSRKYPILPLCGTIPYFSMQ